MEHEFILLIETAAEACSVALSDRGRIVVEKYTDIPKSHASAIAVFIESIFKETGISAGDLSAVAVSEGPGSYTGLRVGVSCAKGLCYGADIPLIAVNTLEAIAQCAIDNALVEDASYIVPMIDARRMEVYTATFTRECKMTSPSTALVLAPESFSRELSEGKVLFTGNGAEKFMNLIPEESRPNVLFAPQLPHASGLRVRAHESLQKKEFENCAYFEPFYLKDFIAGKPKNLLAGMFQMQSAKPR